MNNFNISIFGNKIFLEIIEELKLFSKIKHYEDLNLCVKDAVRLKSPVIFFINEKNKNTIDKNKLSNFPSILISEDSTLTSKLSNEFNEQLIMPFTIIELKKKIISIISKNEFIKNSLIYLNEYIIDKNERKIKKDGAELKLSEKEINFLILFSKSEEPVTRKLVLKNVWNYSSETETHTIETHIYRLRKKILEKFGDNNFIKNNEKGYYI
jgi:DNA-binding winged helix-turn-helix (wHTH) protein